MNRSEKIRHLFEKKINFENNENFALPTEAYTCNKWSIPSFQSQKQELNNTKSLLNQFDLEEWSRHTRQRDYSSYVIRFVKQKFQAELVTQVEPTQNIFNFFTHCCLSGVVQFYECLCNYPVIPKEAINLNFFSSVHLCEAPGAFRECSQPLHRQSLFGFAGEVTVGESVDFDLDFSGTGGPTLLIPTMKATL
jgi:cap2 methyltransferase